LGGGFDVQARADFGQLLSTFGGASLFLVALLFEVIDARRVRSPVAAFA
jgi:hypothetical protein